MGAAALSRHDIAGAQVLEVSASAAAPAARPARRTAIVAKNSYIEEMSSEAESEGDGADSDFQLSD